MCAKWPGQSWKFPAHVLQIMERSTAPEGVRECSTVVRIYKIEDTIYKIQGQVNSLKGLPEVLISFSVTLSHSPP